MNHYWISFMVFLPFIGAIMQAVIPASFSFSERLKETRGPGFASRWIALGASLASALIGIGLIFSMKAAPEPQAVETLSWIGAYAISYEMALDGLNALPVLLVSIIFPLLVASEWNRRVGCREMHGLLLMLQSAMLGAVCAQDLFLLFFFWALAVLPFYFLIGIWGGEKRESAAFRTIVAASIGNALFFAALVLVYYAIEPHTFSLRELSGGKLAGTTFQLLGQSFSVSGVAFGLICAGLALRAPIWPVHGWFTQAAEEAPPSVFVALSAVSVPVAMYIFVRLSYSLFPDTVAHAAHGIVIVGALNLLMGGLCAIAQRGLRMLLAFVCLGEVGWILLGVGSLNPAGAVGSVYQLLAVGLAIAGFGLYYGIMVDRTGQAEFLDEKGAALTGGIATRAPAMALVAGAVIASLLGFPGLGGFVGHSLVMIGGYTVHPSLVILAGVAILLAVYYLFMMYRHVFLGKVTEASENFADLTLRERAYLFPLVGALLVFGVYPKPLIELVRPTVLALLSNIK